MRSIAVAALTVAWGASASAQRLELAVPTALPSTPAPAAGALAPALSLAPSFAPSLAPAFAPSAAPALALTAPLAAPSLELRPPSASAAVAPAAAPAAAPAVAPVGAAAALAALPAAEDGTKPGAPDANGVIFDGAAIRPREDAHGDPVVTAGLLGRAEKAWALAPSVSGRTRSAFRSAVLAADYTAARAAIEDARGEAGRDAPDEYERLTAQISRLLVLPDHPAVKSLRGAINDAVRLRRDGSVGAAMERLQAGIAEFNAGPLADHVHKWNLRGQAIRLMAELKETAIDVYETAPDSGRLRVDRSPAGVKAWIDAARAADPATVVGGYDGRPVAVQRWQDCALQALWNLPALSSIRRRFARYEDFVAWSEKTLNQPLRKIGLLQYDSKRLLAALGFKRGYDAKPKSEADLLARVAAGGVVGSYEFEMPPWRAWLTTGSGKTTFAHAVAIPAAVLHEGRWRFVVLDSGYSRPRLLTYGEMLVLGLETATVEPLPAATQPR